MFSSWTEEVVGQHLLRAFVGISVRRQWVMGSGFPYAARRHSDRLDLEDRKVEKELDGRPDCWEEIDDSNKLLGRNSYLCSISESETKGPAESTFFHLPNCPSLPPRQRLVPKFRLAAEPLYSP